MNKIGKLHYQQAADVPTAVRELIAYHSEKGWPVLEIYGNAGQVQGIGSVDGVRVIPESDRMVNHYWVITGEENV